MFRSIKSRIKAKLLHILDEAHYKYIGFTPFYNRYHDINSNYPEIYNSCGEKMKVFFISDSDFAHDPYHISWSRSPHYFIWDRYNYGLKTHFYSRELAFKPVGSPDKKFAVLIESKAIAPKIYAEYLREKSYFENNFDAVFTYDYDILSSINNAKFAPFCACFWYGKIDKSVKLLRDNYLHKDKNISILSSDKEFCELHRLRKVLAFKCRNEKLADAYGTFADSTEGGGGDTFSRNELWKNIDIRS